MTVREQTENLEKTILCDKAFFSCDATRTTNEEKCVMRTDFQRDRDRILHSNAFRRLKSKTQVFLSPEKDHYRTRLTHTLEVSQIARTIARAMRLNEDLTEAIALGHDLGHTPFGHAGEDVLNNLYEGGFKHYLQSVRVAQVIEKLNLTHQVQNGIACHTTGPVANTLEGQIVKLADKIAYLNHDIDDAIRGTVIKESDIPWHVTYTLGRRKSERITTLISSALLNSDSEIKLGEVENAAFKELSDFMFENVYFSPFAKQEEGKAKDIVAYLYEYFCAHPERLPKQYAEIAHIEGVARGVVDYISGMSDTYAIGIFEDIFVPKSWNI